MNAQLYIETLKAYFQAQANPKQAIPMQNYMRNQFIFLGIPSPLRKQLLKTFIQLHKLPHEEIWEEVIYGLWALPEREMQYIAIELVEKLTKKNKIENIFLFENLITQRAWWDSVDGLAPLVGRYFRQYPTQIPHINAKWLASDSIWLQRVCLIFQLAYRQHTDFELLTNNIQLLHSKNEFFIQKAIGWALRQYSKEKPEEVKLFIQTFPLSGLAHREGSKYINRQMKKL